MVKKVIRAVATVTGFSVVTRLLSFVFKIYLSRTVGAEVIGLYQIALSVFFLFSTLSTGGIPTVLSRRIAECNAVGERRSPALFTGALLLSLTLAVLSAALLAALGDRLGFLFSDLRALPLFRLTLPALISSALYAVVRAWFWGNKRFTEYSVTETVEEVLRILFTALFIGGAVSGIEGAYGIALAFTLSDVAIALLLVLLFFLRGGRLSAKPALKELALPALPLTAMRLFGSFVGTILSLILPARLIAGGASVAYATASVGRISGMANPLLFAPNALIGSLIIVLIPEMSENAAKGNYAAFNNLINKGATLSLSVSGLFLSLYLALGAPLTTLLFADAEAGAYLSAASLLMLLMPLNQLSASALNSVGLEKEGFFTYALGTAFLLLSVYFLPRYIGIYAVVVANALSLAIGVCGNLIILRKKMKLEFGFLKSILMIAVFALSSSILSANVYHLAGEGVGGLVFALGAGTLFYGTLVLLLGPIRISAFFEGGAEKKKKRLLKRRKHVIIASAE